MGWTLKYWDVLNHLYWNPLYLGLKSIDWKKFPRDGDSVRLPVSALNKNGPIYFRKINSRELNLSLSAMEEMLNHIFNLTFAIAPDYVVSRLFFKPLGFSDSGPFESVGRARERFEWRENIAQPDGFFVSDKAALAIELKLKSPPNADQLLKYLALLVCEERLSQSRKNLGLLYIAPPQNEARFWEKCGLNGPSIDSGFLARHQPTIKSKPIAKMLKDRPDEFRSVAERVRLHLMTWPELDASIRKILAELNEAKVEHQTLDRLLGGFLHQLQRHSHTGIASPA